MVDLLDLLSLLCSDWRLDSLAHAQLELVGLRGISLLYCLLVARLLATLALTSTLLDLSRGDSATPGSPRRRGPEEGASKKEAKEKESKMGHYMFF